MATNLFVDLDQFVGELLETMVLVYLGLRLATGGRRRKGFADGPPIDLARQSDLRIMARIVRFGAMATRFTATTTNCADRTGAQIAQGSELAKDLGSLSFQFLKRFGHSDDLLILSVSEHSETCGKKEPEPNHPLLCRAPPYGSMCAGPYGTMR